MQNTVKTVAMFCIQFKLISCPGGEKHTSLNRKNELKSS